MKLSLPTDIIFQQSGAYLVGGSVRDLICNRRPTDYDITVAGDAQGYAQQLAANLKGRLVAIGKRDFPLYRVVKAPLVIDVTPLKGADIASDLADRDFTINALACELTTGNLIDTTGGVADIEQGVVRMVSNRAFQNDPVRLVRAHRMAASFGFAIEPATMGVMATQATTIQSCAGERIWAELALILACANSVDQIQQMAHSGLLTAIFPELKPLKDCRQSKPHHLDVFDHTLLAYHALEAVLAHPTEHLCGPAVTPIATLPKKEQALLKLALLLHDIGKPNRCTVDPSGAIHFYRHAHTSANLARPIFKRLRMSKRQSDWVELIISNHQRPLDLYLSQKNSNLSTKAMGKFLRQCGKVTPHLIIHAMADNLGKKQSSPLTLARMDFFNHLMEAYFKTAAQQNATPLLGGDELMAAFGLTPSPFLGTLLRSIEEERLAGTINDRQQALRWVENHLSNKESI